MSLEDFEKHQNAYFRHSRFAILCAELSSYGSFIDLPDLSAFRMHASYGSTTVLTGKAIELVFVYLHTSQHFDFKFRSSDPSAACFRDGTESVPALLCPTRCAFCMECAMLYERRVCSLVQSRARA